MPFSPKESNRRFGTPLRPLFAEKSVPQTLPQWCAEVQFFRSGSVHSSVMASSFHRNFHLFHQLEITGHPGLVEPGLQWAV